MSKKPEIPPIENKRPEVSSPQDSAGGLPAIISSMKFAMIEAGPLRGTGELLKMNQKGGFDCPGCAWPDPDDKRELTEFCENGAKAMAEEATTKKVDPSFFAKHSVAEMAEWSDYEIGKSGRITHPMFLKAGASHYQPVTWAEAFKLINDELKSLAHANEAVFYTSGRTSNEAAFVYQLFIRMFGTNNLPDCSNMCHESSGIALKESIGVGKGTVTLDDFNKADCILVIGQNPGTNHPRMLTALQKAAKNGAKIISINPLHETGTKAFKHPQQFWTWFGRGTPIESLHLPLKVNGDMAALKGIMKELLAFEEQSPGQVFNWDFIKQQTVGFEDFLSELKSTPWDFILSESGLSRENIKAAAAVIKDSKRMIACWAMGLTQQTQAVACIQEVVNLLLLGGHLGRAGAGVCPVRGHSNVQGDRTMGIYEKPSAEFLKALETEFKFKAPAEHGFDTVEAIRAMHDGQAKVFFGMGGNFLSATPDTEYTASALRKTKLSVQVSTKLNRSHLITGTQALILPCLGRTEADLQTGGPQMVSVENSMGVISSSQGTLEPRSKELRSEVAIVCGLAEAVFQSASLKDLVPWSAWAGNYDLIRDRIEKVIPGFHQYNKRLREPGGFYLPNAVRDTLRFDTQSKKAEFKTHRSQPVNLPKSALMLMTVRSHDQFNTTIYGLNDRYRGISNGRRVIFLNESDIAEQGLHEGQWVDITSHFGGQTRKADRFMVVKYEIPVRSAAAYFPETNVLVPIDSVASKSNTPTYKTIVVTLKPSPDSAQAAG
jgi:molybdopterin-dependent oxidoreductase alpha subunit